jgi:hypothetical protein
MAAYLSASVIKQSANRLIESRAKNGLADFLILKRSLSRSNSASIAFSSRDINFVGAMNEIAGTYPNGMTFDIPFSMSPFVKIFGTADSNKYVSHKYKTNGPADTLAGPNWSSVIEITGSKPRQGALRANYVASLGSLLLKANGHQPTLKDAAIWYHRAQDISPLLGDTKNPAILENALRDAFVHDLGLTTDEIATIFDDDAHPFAGLNLPDVVSDQLADPLDYLPDLDLPSQPLGDLSEILNAFETQANAPAVGLRVSRPLLLRFMAALAAKPFLILGGLSGSGKTKLAQALARWLTPAVEDGETAYALIPVGADWTGNDSILGYPDGLDPRRYVTRPALDLIQRAMRPEHSDEPHFLILDEMNLSHVERYFADLLSLIESDESLELYRPELDAAGVEQLRSGVMPRLRLPPNLFIIGTVNVDETTYMFSPKVLDRANVIEFRMERDELVAFLAAPARPVIESLDGLGSRFGAAFAQVVGQPTAIPAAVRDTFQSELLLFFDLMRDHGLEFGFRVAHEASRFLCFYRQFGGYPEDETSWFEPAMDAIIVQKLLPKLHGSRPRLEGLLWALAWACGADRSGLDQAAMLARGHEAGLARDEINLGPETIERALAGRIARYPLSFDKVMRMWRKLVRDQFVTFSEA